MGDERGPVRQPSGPTEARIRLGIRLRRLREERGITADQAAGAIRASDSKISRIELGRHGVREVDVSDLLAFYGVTDAERAAILELAAVAGQAAWWRGYVDILPTWFQAYLGLEQAAVSVLSYDPQFMPGLLQTPEYAAGLLAGSGFEPAEVDRLLAVRAERIRRFEAAGWRLTAVIEEAVLHRPLGSPHVLRAQLEHLQAMQSILVRPLGAPAAAVPAGFVILHFDDPDLSDVVYTEQLTAASFIDRPTDVARYAATFTQLADGIPADQSPALIAAALARLLG